jgi:large subunit ribosomal protein L4
VEPKGQRPGPRRLEPFAAVGRGWRRLRTQAARFSKKINGKVKALAFSRALFDRARAGELAVIEQFAVAQPKTKFVQEVVGRIAPLGKILLVDAPFAAASARAARNLSRVTLQEAAKLNTHDLASYKKIIVSTKALEAILARVNGGKN